MLSIKRLLSATAAAAIAVAGLAIGAAPANAQGTLVTDKAQFTFEASAANRLDRHKLEYVKIGDYIRYGNTTGGTRYGVRVNSDIKSPDPITTALNYALQDSTPRQQVPSDVDDPLAWALSQGVLDSNGNAPWDGVTRKFATSLVEHMDKLPKPETWTPRDATAQGDKGSYRASIELPAGIYLFRDVTDPVVENSSNAVPMLVGSGTVDDAHQLTDPTSEVRIEMKNYSTEMSFKVDGDTKSDSTGDTASRGETLTYTMNGYVPKTDEVTGDNLEYVNTPQKGLKVDLSSIKVVIVDKDGKPVTAADSASDYSVLTSKDSNVTTEDGKQWFTADGTGDSSTGMTGGHTITVRFTKDTLAKWQNYIGSGYSMQVSYDAVVTADAGSQVDNEFYMSTLPDKKKYAHSVLAKLTFNKVDAAGKPLDGARFRIESSDSKEFELPSGYVNGSANRDASCKPNEAISKDGIVTFDGLAQNPGVTYKITEVSAPSGYITLGLSFDVTVTISDQGKTVVRFYDSTTSDPYGLVSLSLADSDGSNKLTVENVHSIAQLPLTGGAGIAFMVVIAALLGTAGVIVVVRSRRNTTV